MPTARQNVDQGMTFISGWTYTNSGAGTCGTTHWNRSRTGTETITPMPHVMRNLEDGQPAYPWFSFNDHFHDIWIAKIQKEYGILLV